MYSGRTLPGVLGDHLGRFNVMIVFSLLSAIFILTIWVPATSNAGQLVFAPLFGFSSGAAIGLTPALIAQISPLKEIGTRTGTIFFLGAIGTLTGGPIGGALISRDGGEFLYMQIFAAIVCFVSFIFYIAARIVIGGINLKRF